VGQSADQLRQEIAAKRNEAAVKIDQIEAKVQGIPQLARETVDASIQQAKASVGGTVGEMANKMDIRQQVEAKPMLALGAAIAGGWLLGKLLAGDGAKGGGAGGYRRDRDAVRGGTSMNVMHGASVGDGAATGAALQPAGGKSSAGGVVETIRGAARESGLEDTLQAFTGALVATLTDQLRRTVDQSFPEFGAKLREQEQASRQGRVGEAARTFGQGQGDGPPSGSGSAYGTSGAGAMAAGAVDGAGTGPGEGDGYATRTGQGTGLGFGSGASAGAYTGTPSGSGSAMGDAGDANTAAALDADPAGLGGASFGDEGGAAARTPGMGD